MVPEGFEPGERVVVALDASSGREARSLVERLGEECSFYKVGPKLFYREGPAIVEWLRDLGKRVFLDLKVHDIPSVVESATEAAIEMGATFFTAHVAGGSAAAASEAARRAAPARGGKFFVLGVTVLTSADETAVEADCPGTSLRDLLVARARRAAEAGCAGVVAGVPDLRILAGRLPDGMIRVCPGIRSRKDMQGGGGERGLRTGHSPVAEDQKRTATAAEAAAEGADFIVVGRAVLESADPAATLKLIAGEFLWDHGADLAR